MPQTSTAWLGLATLLVGVSFTERGEGVVAIAAALGAIGFALAHRAVNRANRKLRRDIAEEMRLYEPEPDR
ncbi:MAG TPA: hypothetical protein VNO20_06770 [Solirubrobacterales bacterium]|nr:hypothetical protein [Solirubrobacterales bacterium]